MNKLEAIEYLFENDKYTNEWTGAGMWEAVREVLGTKEPITKKWLDELLKTAENF